MREFILELDRPRRLVYDFDAWDRIAERYKPKEGESFDPADLMKLNISARDLPFLVYAGLAWQDQEITEAKTKELLNLGIREGRLTVLGMMNLVVEAIFVQAGLQKKEPGDKTDKDTKDKTKKAPAPKPAIPGSRKRGK